MERNQSDDANPAMMAWVILVATLAGGGIALVCARIGLIP